MSDSAERTEKRGIERNWVMGVMVGVLILLCVAAWWLTTNHDRVEAWVVSGSL